jgi:predicted phosphodiesterase
MKYFIFGDSHGKDMQKLETALLIENPDSLICLGDFDQVKTIRDFMNIEKGFLEKGKEVIKVPGNHDYAILNNQSIKSSALNAKGKTPYQIHQELLRDKEAYDYLSNLVNSDFIVRGFLDKNKFGDKYRFVVMHGAYSGDHSDYPNCPKELEALWNKLVSEKDFSPNFNEMKKRGEKIMIRGHDHFPIHGIRDSNGEDITTTSDGDKYELSEDKEHIINPGAFLFGHFATIDTSGKAPVVEYRDVSYL